MTQKFKRGNLVKVLQGHLVWQGMTNGEGKLKVTDISPEDIGREAVIEGSYKDLYNSGDDDKYSIIFMDTGYSLAWKGDSELELVDEGGEHLFALAEAKKTLLTAHNTDLNVIVSTWKEVGMSQNSETILFIFKKIGHICRGFEKRGEFFSLYRDWELIYPFITLIMDAEVEADVTFALKDDCPLETREKVISFFNEVKAIKEK